MEHYEKLSISFRTIEELEGKVIFQSTCSPRLLILRH